MKLFQISINVSLLLLIASCASLQTNITSENNISLTKENLHYINGTYINNNNNGPSTFNYFWGSYFRTKDFYTVYKMNTEGKPTYVVSLNVISKTKVKATIKVNDTVLKSFIIKGKIKNGYFEQNGKWHIIPALLYNEYHSSKFRIGLGNDNKIITDYKQISFGTVYFISPFNNGESIYNMVHDRVAISEIIPGD